MQKELRQRTGQKDWSLLNNQTSMFVLKPDIYNWNDNDRKIGYVLLSKKGDAALWISNPSTSEAISHTKS